jgi:hypothetical protein
MAYIDPNEVWLGHVQPVGLVVAPIVLARHGLLAIPQTRADTEVARALIAPKLDDAGAKKTDPRALRDPWAFFQQILGWRPEQVAGAPGGPALPDDLSLRVEEGDTEIAPHWAVTDPAGGWQILVRIEEPGVRPDERGALAGWEATPHQRLERLLREKEIPTGVLITDDELRFIYAPRGETSGWITFPLRSLCEVGGREMLSGLKLLLSSFRLHNAAPEQRLPALLKASRDAQAEVSTKLASQVLGALHELLRGLHAADRERIEALAASQQDHLYDGLLTVLLRLVFLLYAEDRDLIPSRTDAAARAFYAEGYGVRSLYARLLDDKTHYPDTMEERRGAWPRLLALFRLIHDGDSSGAWIRGRGGKLFDPKAFPFLQGQEEPNSPPSPAPVADGCIQRILDLLVTVDGDKLSYRTLDVEQIGSVYETVMGFTIDTRRGPALAIRAGKNDRTPVFVDIDALAATKGADRTKFLKEKAGRNALADRVARSLVAADGTTEVIEALRPIIDERGSPGGHPVPAGTPLLQPTDERRRTGSHYTPRSLTAPIVQHALEPAFERLGPDARPEEVLDLKICDPAMGSGAFLVEACRAIGDRLVKAWERWPETRPTIPADEDEPLHARRLVAQRCLYGVDKNPRAVDLAKLSLWLATLARDHEFTFLDHALRCGDSLVCLTIEQIIALHWDRDKAPTLVGNLVRDHLREAGESRAQIRESAESATEIELGSKLVDVDRKLSVARLIGDAVIASFFFTDKPRPRIARLVDLQRAIQSHIGSTDWVDAIAPFVANLGDEPNLVRPFHWQIEFPEVFARDNGGFDAIVGNPPFAGKNTIIAGSAKNYLAWLQTMHKGAHGNADLVAHFFLRAFCHLRNGGVFGLIATKTIGQGDTRETGLATILADGGTIARATRRLKWPGEAAVTVSVVHVVKGRASSVSLDGQHVPRISAYLVQGDLDTSPLPLAFNARKAFQGSILLGMGFTFDDDAAQRGTAEDLTEMRRLIAKDPRNADRIFPYIGGEEVNNSPSHAHHRFAIDFGELPLRRDGAQKSWSKMTDAERTRCRITGIVPQDYAGGVAEDWPDLIEIIRRRVKPERDRQKRAVLRDRWWQYAEKRPGLYSAISGLDRVLVTLRVKEDHAVTFVNARAVYANTLYVSCLSA